MISYTVKNKKHKNNNLRQTILTRFYKVLDASEMNPVEENPEELMHRLHFIVSREKKWRRKWEGEGRGVMPIISQVVLKQLTEPLRFHPKDPAPA